MINRSKRTYHAIILAAGYGTRLAPVTDVIPKPLIPVGERTLLENILVSLNYGGVAKFAINTHHLGEKLEKAVKDSKWSDRVIFYPETEILGTGGPLVNAKDFLTDCDGFVLHNGDILTDLSIKNLIDHHEKSSSPITMVMIDGPENKVAVDENGIVVDILGKLGREKTYPKKTYAGISVFSREIFDFLPPEPEFCSVITAILAAMKNNPKAVSAFIPDLMDSEEKLPNYQITKLPNIYWNDLGTVEKFLDVQHDIADGKIILPELKSSITLPMSPLPYPGASERMFFRVNGRETKILMCASKDSADFERFVNIGEFLNDLNLGVPEIYNLSSGRHVVIMEDLGDDILYNRLQTGLSEYDREILYKKAIKWLVKFQNETFDFIYPEGENAKEGGIAVRLFDFDYLRWETSYFAQNFLINYCELRKEDIDELDCEFRKLAEETLNQPQVLIHRDFQSQNILFQNDDIHIVDFQGARIGNIAYDLMSLLKDPYIEIPKNLRNSLTDYYFELFAQTNLAEKIILNREEFAKFAATAALQRNMQALGAYGFLGLQKGKKKYLQHIPQGLTYLKDGLLEMQKFNTSCLLPKLNEVIKEIFL